MTASALVSMVIPAYNEADGLAELAHKLSELGSNQWGDRFEFIVVDDGSTDKTWQRLLAWADKEPRLTAVRLAGNHGAHRAGRAGLAIAAGDAMLVLPADLQEGLDLLDACLEKWHQNGKMVVMMVPKSSRPYERWYDGIAARLVYLLLRCTSRIHGDLSVKAVAKLMDRVSVRAYLEGSSPFALRTSFVLQQKFPYDVVVYEVRQRNVGKSKWSLRKKIALTFDMLFESASWIISPWPFAVMGFLLYVGLQLLYPWTGEAAPVLSCLSNVVFAASVLVILSLIGMQIGRIYRRQLGGPAFVIRQIRRGAIRREHVPKSDESSAELDLEQSTGIA